MAEAIEANYARGQLRAINQALSEGRFVSVRKQLHEMPPSDVALILESSPTKTRDDLWELLDSDFHGDVIEELSEEVRNGIIAKMMPAKVVDALEDVSAAQQDANAMRNRARAYVQQVMARAQGDSAAFNQIYGE